MTSHCTFIAYPADDGFSEFTLIINPAVVTVSCWRTVVSNPLLKILLGVHVPILVKLLTLTVHVILVLFPRYGDILLLCVSAINLQIYKHV